MIPATLFLLSIVCECNSPLNIHPFPLYNRGKGCPFYAILSICKQIFALKFGGFKKKSYLCTAKQKKWRFRLGVRTHASHAWNTGSIPVVATQNGEIDIKVCLFFICITY